MQICLKKQNRVHKYLNSIRLEIPLKKLEFVTNFLFVFGKIKKNKLKKKLNKKTEKNEANSNFSFFFNHRD